MSTDRDIMTDWVSSVQGTRSGCRRRSLLVLNSLRSHSADEVRKSIKKTNTDITMIPRGLTCILQPLDVAINRPFKAEMQRLGVNG